MISSLPLFSPFYPQFRIEELGTLMKHFACKGQGSIELVMSLLFFVMMLGTLLSLSLYMYMNHVFLTAAKEGARVAAADSNFGNGNTTQGTTDVQTWVNQFVQSSSGITLNANNVTVSGPNGSQVGSRTMTVTVSYQFNNPVQIRGFIDRLNGGSGTGLDTFNITNTATMRYEE